MEQIAHNNSESTKVAQGSPFRFDTAAIGGLLGLCAFAFYVALPLFAN